ncbi:hypothetical protein CCH79_00018071 [Gambusia affinis]|uniref:Claudin n=1 Tax=Gambusia affinis TaxID=33528 RepID=A0A315UNQ0_GAMAF|nr:hypothetical protein CCH79_00018071 [Gambusia affinis]
MSTAVEAAGFIMCLIGFLITGVALSNDYWKISSVSGSVIVSQREFENLWHACAENSAGIANCRDFESMLALPGLCCIIACSWYGYQVVQEFYNPLYGGAKFELGTGLYLGWAGGSLCIVGGSLLCTACKRASPAGKKGGYPAKKVYTATARTDTESTRAYV